MALASGGRLDLGELLAAVENASPVDAADCFAAVLAEALGASDVSFLIADFAGQSLVRLGHAGSDAATRFQGAETAEYVPIAGTAQGRALGSQDVTIEPTGHGARLLAPVTTRGEAIGILDLTLTGAPGDEVVADVALAAHLFAYVVIANRRFTDLFEWGQRSVPFTLAAEIQHRLLPSAYTCEAGQFTLAAWLEPAGNVGGDTFDFSLDRDTLHISMTDAMGHTVDASALATVLVGALRNARRAGVGLAEQAAFANTGLRGFVRHGEFVTGQVGRLNLREGTASIVNAGHPPPMRLRGGRVEPVALEADPPFGIEGDVEYQVQSLPLEPGDRIVFLTDGMLDRVGDSVDIAALIERGGSMHPREAVQYLIRAVLEATSGALQDDATVMCLDWHGGPPRERDTDFGANR